VTSAYTKPTAWDVIGETVMERQSWMLAIFGIILSVVTYFVAKTTMIPLWSLIFTAMILIYLIIIMFAAIARSIRLGQVDLPAVLTVVQDNADQATPILLLAPSPLFGTSTLVSIYHRDHASGFEVLVGHGTVRTVQSDSKIQVKIDQWVEGSADIAAATSNNNAEIICHLIVRPSVVRERAPASEEVNLLRQFLTAMQNQAGDAEVLPEMMNPEPNDGQ
jgi:hypothetical protein